MKTEEQLNSEKEALKENTEKYLNVRWLQMTEETEFGTIFLKPLTEVTYKATMKVIEKDGLAAAKC